MVRAQSHERETDRQGLDLPQPCTSAVGAPCPGNGEYAAYRWTLLWMACHRWHHTKGGGSPVSATVQNPFSYRDGKPHIRLLWLSPCNASHIFLWANTMSHSELGSNVIINQLSNQLLFINMIIKRVTCF